MKRATGLAAVGVALLVGGGCGGDTATTTSPPLEPATSTAATTSTVSPATTAPPPTASATTTTAAPPSTTSQPDTNLLADGSGCTPGGGALPDGTWFGLVGSIGEDTLDFDLACWFSGDAAVIAAAEDGEESPPPNDYYVRNANPRIRELPVAADTLVLFYPDGDPANQLVISFAEWADLSAERGFQLGVWVDTVDGIVRDVREQWVP